jgi:tyrosinase
MTQKDFCMSPTLITKTPRRNTKLKLVITLMLLGSWQVAADGSYRISVKDFSADPVKVKALRQGIERMKASSQANPKSAQYRTSFAYWSNTHGFFGTGGNSTDLDTYIAQRMPDCIKELGEATCKAYYQHMSNTLVPDDGFTAKVWGTCQHHNLNFLPWHRMYLYFYEKTLRKHVGDPTFSLPYWDYFQEPSPDGKGLALPSLVRGPTATPLYNQFRTPGLNENKTAIDPDSASAAQAFAFDDFIHFSNQLQGQPHGTMHCALGTGCVTPDMGFVPIAGLDPVFYMHHANIDRLWQCWLNKKAGGKTIDLAWAKANLDMPDSWYQISYSFADENGNQVTMSIADVFTPGKIPVRYSQETACAVQKATPKQLLAQASEQKNKQEQAQQKMTKFKAHAPVSSKKAVDLRGLATKVALDPQHPAQLKSSDKVELLAHSTGDTYLILQDVKMIGSPATTYKIYLSSEQQQEQKLYVATINYFGVNDHAHAGHDMGAMGNLIYKVTDLAQQLGHVAAADLMVHFIPTNLTTTAVQESSSQSGVTVGQIRLETAPAK